MEYAECLTRDDIWYSDESAYNESQAETDDEFLFWFLTLDNDPTFKES